MPARIRSGPPAMVEQLLRAAHGKRLADVRSRRVLDVSVPVPSEAVDAEELLRLALVRMLPRAERDPAGCADLLTAVMPLEPAAQHDLRALDAWHHAFEAAEQHRLDPRSTSYAAFLCAYERILLLRL